MLDDTVYAALGGARARVAVEMCVCRLTPPCCCRKPRPGMVLRLLAHFEVEPEDAPYVGDLDLDRVAAKAARVPFRWASEFFGWTPARDA
jgi:histidinol phosphatase-like enzyme